LLVAAPVNEGDIIQRECADRTWVNKISEEGLGMESGITDNIRHPSLLPANELLFMTVHAGVGANEVFGLG
jgi:hypothetical protein